MSVGVIFCSKVEVLRLSFLNNVTTMSFVKVYELY